MPPNIESSPELNAALQLAVLEQMMRVTRDEYFALRVREATTTTALRAAIGEVLTETPVTFRWGTPFMVACGHGDLDENWQTNCPAKPGSLWEHLEFYRAVGYTPQEVTGDPLHELWDAATVDEARLGVDR